MRPNAKEDICNLSLDLLKQQPIVNIDTPVTSTEFIMNRWYDIERQAALRAHPWKFATKRITLTPNPSTPPLFGYQYAYDLPSDYIRMVSIGDDFLRDLRHDHVIENGQILASCGNNVSAPLAPSTLYVRYIYDCVNISQFDPLFIKFFALQTAVDLAPKFSISAALGRDLQVKYLEVDTMARAVNGQDAPIQRIQSSRLLKKRRGLPGGIFANRYTVFDS